MLRDIHLYGYLGEHFGKKHRLNVESFGESIRACYANFGEDFIKDIRSGQFKIYKGEELIKENQLITEDDLKMDFKKGSFHIVPYIEGAKSEWFGIILGIMIIAVAWWNPLGWVAATQLAVGMMGASMLMSGVSMMLTPTPTMPDYSQRERPEDRPSFLYNGPVNTMEQGGPVPLIYGQMILGSTVLQAEMDIEEL